MTGGEGKSSEVQETCWSGIRMVASTTKRMRAAMMTAHEIGGVRRRQSRQSERMEAYRGEVQ